MKQLECFIKIGYEQLVYKINKVFYRLRQVAWTWYKKIDNLFFKLHMPNCKANPNLYFWHNEINILFVMIYMGFFFKRGITLSWKLLWTLVGSKTKLRRLTSGYFLKIKNSLMSWCGRKQSTIVLSLAETAYRTWMEGIKEGVWLKKLPIEIGYIKLGPTTLFCNNVNNIKMAKNPIFHAWTKYIECHYHFVHEKVLSEDIDIKHVPSCQQ